MKYCMLYICINQRFFTDDFNIMFFARVCLILRRNFQHEALKVFIAVISHQHSNAVYLIECNLVFSQAFIKTWVQTRTLIEKLHKSWTVVEKTSSFCRSQYLYFWYGPWVWMLWKKCYWILLKSSMYALDTWQSKQ